MSSLQGTVNRHLTVLLFVASIALTWHSLFLLATYQVYPIVLVGGWLTRTRVGIISFAALLVPLCTPRPYKHQASHVLTELAGPIGIRYILKYLENPFQTGYFRPWVWILWLFLGPVIGAIAMQWYVFTTCGMVDRIEAMVTQLLFEHSLRIRMTSEDSSYVNKDLAQSTGPKRIYPGPNKEKRNLSSSHLVGRIHNLISADLNNISQDFLFVLFFAPLRVVFNGILTYPIFSAIIGLFVMIGLLLIPGKVVSRINGIQVEWANKTDARVQSIVESLNIIRTIKLFAWEKRVKTQSEKERQEELNQYRKRQFLGLFTTNINFALPLVVMIVTFASHTLLFKRSLDASSMFSSIAVFDTLRTQFRLLFLQIPSSIQSKVSLDRINDFFKKTELLDSYNSGRDETSLPSGSAIGFSNVTFMWSTIQNGSSTQGKGFRLQIDKNLSFQRGRINMIIGPTGCGKTSLLMALLGELHYIPNGPDYWVSLPRGSTAYAAQEAWIQNTTIEENILFGTEHDEERYKKVIFQCGLETDLKMLKSGDQTEVGEKGVTLSGGQRARVSLARAIYSKAEIIILDDILSALDVHTSRWIIDKCFRGDLVVGRTLIVATHNVAMVSEIANFIVALEHGGRILNQGSVETVLGSTSKLREKVGQVAANNPEEPADEETAKTVTEQPNTKLATAEEVAEGHVGWSALKMFFFALGGVGFWIVYLTGFILANVAALLQTYWLGIWARAYDVNPTHPQQVNVFFYLGVYSSICLCSMFVYSLALIVHILGSIRASRRIHDQLVSSVFSAPLYWLDSTPVGRIIARFTQDVRAVDGSLPNQLQNLTDMTIQLFSRFIAIILVSPAFTFAGALLLVLGIWIGQVYITAQLCVKRHMSNARSPMFSYFHAALAGIPTIRAYGAQEIMRKELQKRIDIHTRAARTFWSLNRWIAIRMDALGGLFSASLAAWLVYVRTGVDPSDAGFSLNTAVALSGGILWWVRTLNEFQVQTNSLERIHAYLDIPHEPGSEEYPTPPAYWPSSGSLVVHNLNAHRTNRERKEFIGVALLRMIRTSGEVYYDGMETNSIPLESLRSNVTVVPQQPELSSGTVRENLDPFNEWEDAVLWDALRAVGLAQDMSDSSGTSRAHIGLDTPIAPGGSNLSLGQRQMVALARAIVRRTKLVVLDEATAAIDHETDNKIHHALESLDQTVLIVAHRLRTICNVDKVMVLGAGRLVEFDSPQELLRKGGAFKSLVDGSGERNELYALIERASSVA
ncbi:ABC transporter type 1, transmembrane domain-containing protein [Rhizoctonia solani]|nr:ABC transporter type 1, transmembrane domain-containing protein [Rhizoctonia solani]